MVPQTKDEYVNQNEDQADGLIQDQCGAQCQ
jgi:hypothetical protein